MRNIIVIFFLIFLILFIGGCVDEETTTTSTVETTVPTTSTVETTIPTTVSTTTTIPETTTTIPPTTTTSTVETTVPTTSTVETTIPTTVSTTTTIPETTTTSTVETTVNEPEPILIFGEGMEATSFFELEEGLSIFEMKHDGDSNFIIWLYDDDGDRIDLLVNEIGEFDGSTAIGIEKSGNYLLDITADGNWEVEIKQPRDISSKSVPRTLTGEGKYVSEFLYFDKGLSIFEMKHDGDSNFIIWLYDDDGDRIDLLVNEIGEFDGSTAIGIEKSGNYLLDITADGNWEVSIE